MPNIQEQGQIAHGQPERWRCGATYPLFLDIRHVPFSFGITLFVTSW